MKSTKERLTSLAEVVDLWQTGHLNESRAIMMIHGLTSTHIHEILTAKIHETVLLEKSLALAETVRKRVIKNTDWRKIEIRDC